MRTSRILCFARGLAAALGCLSWALAASDKGAVLKPVLVELFTSEGCSSCPPADNLLASLDKSQPISGVHIIVLSEHVDYWDSKSWTDPFSSPDVSLRQRAYDTRLKVDAPYTPEAIVDGRRECVGSDRSAIQAAIIDAARAPKYDLRIVPGRKPQSVSIEAEGPFPEAADVYVAFALDTAESKVSGGENSGRTLRHVAVLRKLRKIGKLGDHPQFRSEVSVSDVEAGRIVAFVQEKGVGRILGAAVYRIIERAGAQRPPSGSLAKLKILRSGYYADTRRQPRLLKIPNQRGSRRVYGPDPPLQQPTPKFAETFKP